MWRMILPLALYLLLALAAPGDTLRLTPVERLAAVYRYNLLAWEVTHVPAKWLWWLGQSLFPFSQRSESPLGVVDGYFSLGAELRHLRGQLEQAVVAQQGDAAPLEKQIKDVQQRRYRLRPQAEAALEAAITTVLREERVPFGMGKIAFPPVDFAMDDLPTVLVVSPRDRIQLQERVLLTPDISPEESERLEETILRQEDLSALVEGLGGVSTYPSIINSGDLRGALSVASHEWLHQYLFFRPLGQSYYRSPGMGTLNETLADLFGEEVASTVLARLKGEAVPGPQKASGPVPPAPPCPQDRFCFGREMRTTRLRVEEMLAQGKVEEAEAYMEERRKLFVQQGYPIRKLNQAYFAFHGTYADSPASISPASGQLQSLRQAYPSLGAFVRAVAGVSSDEEFQALLRQMVSPSGP